MNMPVMWVNTVGWAIVWEKHEMGQAPEVWLVGQSKSGLVYITPAYTIDPEIGTLFRTEVAATEALKKWKASEEAAEFADCDFRVCALQAAYVASPVA